MDGPRDERRAEKEREDHEDERGYAAKEVDVDGGGPRDYSVARNPTPARKKTDDEANRDYQKNRAKRSVQAWLEKRVEPLPESRVEQRKKQERLHEDQYRSEERRAGKE